MQSLTILAKKGKTLSEKTTYETRKQQVTAIRNRISDASADHVNDINRKIDSIGTKLERAITGIDMTTLTGQFSGKKEKSGTYDSRLNSYELELNNEIADCNTKIGELESSISSLDSQYRTAVHEEQEAAKKSLEAVQKKFPLHK